MCFMLLTIMYNSPYVYIMYSTSIEVYICVCCSHGLVKHGLKNY
jgi:hypothetical protein